MGCVATMQSFKTITPQKSSSPIDGNGIVQTMRGGNVVEWFDK